MNTHLELCRPVPDCQGGRQRARRGIQRSRRTIALKLPID